MLDPRSREMLMASLRPPDGFTFDCAIGTTFSLDLIALLATPLAFAMFDHEQEAGTTGKEQEFLTADPLALLESLRRCADRIHVFCQAGQIKVPPTNQRLLMYLEQMVIEVQPPSVKRGGKGVFHPKVWILRFMDGQSSVRYRLLCLSRNLTFERSWDTVLVLDGERTDRQRAFSVNGPLVEFVSALPQMALHEGAITPQAESDIRIVEAELRVVNWDLTGLDGNEIHFVPLGLSEKTECPFPGRIDRLLVVSPFVEAGFLQKFKDSKCQKYLVARVDVLQTLPPKSLQNQWACYTLDGVLEPDSSEADSDATHGAKELSGLHAKLFVMDEGWKSHLWTGSANATNAAFAGNVEFLVQLTGMKSKMGVGAFIEEKQGQANLRSLLTEYLPPTEAVICDAAQKQLDEMLENYRSQIINLSLAVQVQKAGDTEDSCLTVVTCERPLYLADGVAAYCRPALLPANYSSVLPADGPVKVSFGPHAVESVSSFVAFDIVATLDGVSGHSSFVLNLPLSGAPSDRREQLLRSMLRDPKTLFRFLMLVLSDDPEAMYDELRRQSLPFQTDRGSGNDNSLPLLEQLLCALQRNPEKLTHLQRIVEDLSRGPQGCSILTPEFLSIWEPTHRVALRRLKSSRRKGAK